MRRPLSDSWAVLLSLEGFLAFLLGLMLAHMAFWLALYEFADLCG
jgi:hypothetical protein